jgi:hypothetical protein
LANGPPFLLYCWPFSLCFLFSIDSKNEPAESAAKQARNEKGRSADNAKSAEWPSHKLFFRIFYKAVLTHQSHREQSRCSTDSAYRFPGMQIDIPVRAPFLMSGKMLHGFHHFEIGVLHFSVCFFFVYCASPSSFLEAR